MIIKCGFLSIHVYYGNAKNDNPSPGERDWMGVQRNSLRGELAGEKTLDLLYCQMYIHPHFHHRLTFVECQQNVDTCTSEYKEESTFLKHNKY